MAQFSRKNHDFLTHPSPPPAGYAPRKRKRIGSRWRTSRYSERGPGRAKSGDRHVSASLRWCQLATLQLSGGGGSPFFAGVRAPRAAETRDCHSLAAPVSAKHPTIRVPALANGALASHPAIAYNVSQDRLEGRAWGTPGPW